jgi:hypothetical protein
MVYQLDLTRDATCYICDKPMYAGDPCYATGRGGSRRLYCSSWCADPRPCTGCRHPQRYHAAWGCFAPVVDRYGNEDACTCRVGRGE